MHTSSNSLILKGNITDVTWVYGLEMLEMSLDIFWLS